MSRALAADPSAASVGPAAHVISRAEPGIASGHGVSRKRIPIAAIAVLAHGLSSCLRPRSWNHDHELHGDGTRPIGKVR